MNRHVEVSESQDSAGRSLLKITAPISAELAALIIKAEHDKAQGPIISHENGFVIDLDRDYTKPHESIPQDIADELHGWNGREVLSKESIGFLEMFGV